MVNLSTTTKLFDFFFCSFPGNDLASMIINTTVKRNVVSLKVILEIIMVYTILYGACALSGFVRGYDRAVLCRGFTYGQCMNTRANIEMTGAMYMLGKQWSIN